MPSFKSRIGKHANVILNSNVYNKLPTPDCLERKTFQISFSPCIEIAVRIQEISGSELFMSWYTRGHWYCYRKVKQTKVLQRNKILIQSFGRPYQCNYRVHLNRLQLLNIHRLLHMAVELETHCIRTANISSVILYVDTFYPLRFLEF